MNVKVNVKGSVKVVFERELDLECGSFRRGGKDIADFQEIPRDIKFTHFFVAFCCV